MCSFRALQGGMLLMLLTALPVEAAPPRGPAPRSSTVPDYAEHKVTRGETLWSISQKHQTSVGVIMDFNHLPNQTVREGMILRIPRRATEDPRKLRQHIHVIESGETFWSIAEKYDVAPALLAQANPNINPNRVHEDMELIIPVREGADVTTRDDPAPPAPSPKSGSMIQHTVGENETFYSIGRRYRVPMDSIVAANPSVKPERLRAGMKVWVPSKNPAPVKPTTPAATKPVNARTHTIAEGESIASIAKKHGVSESDLLRENKLDDDDAIFVGDVLKIPGSGNYASPARQPQGKPDAGTPSKPPSAPTKPAGGTPPNTVGNDGTIRSYIVSAGEDESTICEAFGISKQQLYEYNRLAPGTRLKPGDEIAIPRVAKVKKR